MWFLRMVVVMYQLGVFTTAPVDCRHPGIVMASVTGNTSVTGN